MSFGLPEGLVTASSNITGELERLDRMAVEDVIQLWKGSSRAFNWPIRTSLNLCSIVYSTSKAILPGGIGRRLDNFFWRIWSKPEILNHLRGSQVAVLFGKVCEGGLTSARPRRSSKSLESPGDFSPMGDFGRGLTRSLTARSNSPNSAECAGRESGEESLNPRNLENLRCLGAAVASQQSKKEPNLPPSILKKNRSDSSQLGKSTRILSPKLESSISSPSEEANIMSGSPLSRAKISMGGAQALRLERAPSAQESKKPAQFKSKALPPEAVAMSEKGAKSSGVESQKPIRKKPTIHAKTGASRRKPAVTRRKSSQTSITSASGIIPSSKDKKTRNEPAEVGSTTEATYRRMVQSARCSRTTSPHPLLKRSAKATTEEVFVSDNDEDSPTSLSRKDHDLVEPNFRTKFVSRVHPERRPFGSLPPLEHTSAQAAGTFSPYQGHSTIRFDEAIRGDGKGKRIAGFNSDISSGLKPHGGRAMGSNESDEDVPSVLPRTKSQLTLLLQQERQAGQK